MKKKSIKSLALPELDESELQELSDRILAGYYSDLKFIQALKKRKGNKEYYIFYDRFCLKNFVQEYNVIRNISKDAKGVSIKEKNLYKLSALLKAGIYRSSKVDGFAAGLRPLDISKVNPVSLTSKLFFLGNPKQIFIYDSLVKKATCFDQPKVGVYTSFYKHITSIVKMPEFKKHIDFLERRLKTKLAQIESWCGYEIDVEKIRRMRITDKYLMFLGIIDRPLTIEYE